MSYVLNCRFGAHSNADVEIHASVLRWVYATGSEKPPPKALTISTASNFFSSFISSFKAPGLSSSRPDSIALPSADYLDVLDSSVQVQVFSADVNVKLPNKLALELERATKKRPPNNYLYQLIYVSAIYFAVNFVAHYFYTDRKGRI